jgi:hypothetical protein
MDEAPEGKAVFLYSNTSETRMGYVTVVTNLSKGGNDDHLVPECQSYSKLSASRQGLTVSPETPGLAGRSSELVPVRAPAGLAPVPAQPPGIPQIPTLRELPRLPQSWDDKVTRHVCHAVHLLEPLQSFVHHSIVDPRVRAICPSYGIDLVAVARHATLARKRRILLGRIVIVFRIAIAVAVALAVVQTVRSVSNQDGFDVTPLIVAAAVIVLIVIAAWAVVFWHVRAGRASAHQVLSGPRPRDQASPIDPATEDRLEEVNRASVVVYARGQGDPFIGSGRKLFSWNTDPIDITRAATDSSGGKRVVRPFDEIDLHNYLEAEIPRLGFDELEVRHRLYVRGDRAKNVGGLLPDLSAVPGSLVDGRWLASGLKHPSEQARTYLCMERIQMGGNLVTCMYVRARIEQKLLTLDGLIYLLPPLAEFWLPSRDLVAGGQVRAAWLPFGRHHVRRSPFSGGGQNCCHVRIRSRRTRARKSLPCGVS